MLSVFTDMVAWFDSKTMFDSFQADGQLFCADAPAFFNTKKLVSMKKGKK